MKKFDEVYKESTCQKRVTITEIYDKKGTLLSRASNRCNPEGGFCHRLETKQTKDEYPIESSCNWTHSEIMAIKSLPDNCNPYKAICYGHTFFCDNCENELKKIGVVEFETVEWKDHKK